MDIYHVRGLNKMYEAVGVSIFTLSMYNCLWGNCICHLHINLLESARFLKIYSAILMFVNMVLNFLSGYQSYKVNSKTERRWIKETHSLGNGAGGSIAADTSVSRSRGQRGEQTGGSGVRVKKSLSYDVCYYS